ncbi:G-patch domain-containing protein [Reticulomyxa filosa]|uniref:G-patch domain-containing protein n=1 Tax=Reticulomyxa filosa TaxID=46433 RepID=X6NUG4_RETFI|nr:G-patch domain-containing protein [Reticulomyxa filosa]|eukprot:ETO29676.1 G-patch domain-containing protein [Reticulomyxa filosa]
MTAVYIDSDRKKGKARSSLRSCGTRHGEEFWDEESNKGNFGMKYMEKFGWKKGDGLGANRQGRNSYIKVRHKQDNLGEHTKQNKHKQMKGLGANQNATDSMFKTTMLMYNELLTRIKRGKTESDKSKNQNEDSDSDSSGVSDTNVTTAFRRFEARTTLYIVI